jgi:hypothetical protein
MRTIRIVILQDSTLALVFRMKIAMPCIAIPLHFQTTMHHEARLPKLPFENK